jgi:excisionase family DNA binding protein
MSQGAVLQLVKVGLMPALRGPGMGQGPVWVFSKVAVREALDHLIGHLAVRPVTEPGDRNSLSLRSVMRVVSAASITLPEVLQTLQSGQLVGFRLSDDVTLTTLRIERVHLEAFMTERRRVERSGILSVEAVRRALHCSVTTLQRWHTSKLLEPFQERTSGTKTHWQYRRQEVQTFIECYITVREASALLGCTRLTLQGWARAGTLPAVSGPRVDGVHSYRFDKAVITEWRKHRLTSHEVAEWLGTSKPTLHRWVNQGKLIPLDKGKGKHRWFAKEEIVGYNKASSRSESVPTGC